MAPIAPFFAEQLFTDLNRVTGKKAVDSVHLTDFPSSDQGMIDKDLEERMEIAQNISSMVLSIRKKTNIRVRQPLNRILLPLLNEHLKVQIDSVKNLILSEVNVKRLEYITDTEGILVKTVKADFKRLGPRFGKLMKPIVSGLASLSQKDIGLLEKEGKLSMKVEGQDVELLKDDVEILSEDIPGWQAAKMGNLTVALDITLTDELKSEGIARELVNRVQNLRKEKGFEVTDKIRVKIRSCQGMDEAVNQNISYICSEILAQSFEIKENLEGNNLDEIELTEGIKTYIAIEKMA
jgi:isoleucyl-tRNA synthetase